MQQLKVKVHFLTCTRREEDFRRTLRSLLDTGWKANPHIHVDLDNEAFTTAWGEADRSRRITSRFANMMRRVLEAEGENNQWFLFLEDDIDFHPRIGTHVAAWEALNDPRCVIASLFNPSLQAIEYPNTPPNTFAANPKTFLGAQALLLRRSAVQRAVAEWDNLTGMQSQRLAKLFGDEGPIWVHKPSLVQHVATDSSWGARIQRALDFDPAWEPKKQAPIH